MKPLDHKLKQKRLKNISKTACLDVKRKLPLAKIDHGEDSIICYNCGNGYIIVKGGRRLLPIFVKEDDEVFFTTDHELTRPENLLKFLTDETKGI